MTLCPQGGKLVSGLRCELNQHVSYILLPGSLNEELTLTAVGEANGVATLEDSLVFSDKTKTLQSYHPTIALLGINPKELKSVCPHKTLHIDVFYSFIHNHPNLEATKIPFSR